MDEELQVILQKGEDEINVRGKTSKYQNDGKEILEWWKGFPSSCVTLCVEQSFRTTLYTAQKLQEGAILAFFDRRDGKFHRIFSYEFHKIFMNILYDTSVG